MKNNSKIKLVKEVIFYILGIILIIGFVYLYWSRFVIKTGIPPVIRKLYYSGKVKEVFLLNVAVFVLFIIFLPYRKKIEWRSKGAFSAFMLALFAEMFGIPLLMYILSPLFAIFPFEGLGIHHINHLRHYFVFGWYGMVMGSYMTLIGLVLVFIGWIQIHKANELVNTVLYKYIRHPQYTGLFLIITGWILHWLNFLMVFMYPILLVIYYRLAIKEEKELIVEFGEQYKHYQQNTKMFIPFIL